MPKVHEMKESKFLKKEDVGDEALMTVNDVRQFNVAMQGADPEMKWCMVFEEVDKPLVLNQTNIQLCQMALKSDDTDDWRGKQVVLYADPTISYGGKMIGGIRVRASQRPQPAKKLEPVPPPLPPAPSAIPAMATGEPMKDSDIPF